MFWASSALKDVLLTLDVVDFHFVKPFTRFARHMCNFCLQLPLQIAAIQLANWLLVNRYFRRAGHISIKPNGSQQDMAPKDVGFYLYCVAILTAAAPARLGPWGRTITGAANSMNSCVIALITQIVVVVVLTAVVATVAVQLPALARPQLASLLWQAVGSRWLAQTGYTCWSVDYAKFA